MKKIILCAVLVFVTTSLYAQNHIIVSKKNSTLTIVGPKADTLYHCKCSVGLNLGDKQKVGDKRTPEGQFSVSMIQDSKHWTHDFGDGAGPRPYAYGPYFIRLKTPKWSGIGIHGTCFPESIGTRSSEGCIRLLNDDIAKVAKIVKVGDKVTIEKDIVE
ncbi:MAG: L,D-transpeptidase [Alistipes sp.]|nr:L,D-transpeptidase [Alistipes sp.]